MRRFSGRQDNRIGKLDPLLPPILSRSLCDRICDWQTLKVRQERAQDCFLVARRRSGQHLDPCGDADRRVNASLQLSCRFRDTVEMIDEDIGIE